MKDDSYRITDKDVQEMVSFLVHYAPESANTIMARKILEQMQKDIQSATPEDILAIYAALNKE